MRGQNNATLLIVGLIAVVAVIALVAQNMGFFGVTSQPQGFQPIPPAGGNCPTDGSGLDVKASSRNAENSSIEYQAASFKVETAGVLGVTGTGTAGASETLTTLSGVPCSPRSGKVYALSTTALASAVADYSVPNGDTQAIVRLIQPDASQAQTKLFDTALTNTSVDFAATQTETTAVDMSAGGTRSGYLDIKAPTGSSVFGGPEVVGMLWLIDTVDGDAFTDTAISLSSLAADFQLTEVDCATYAKALSKDSANRCYTSRALKASDGEKRIQWSMSNNAGTNAGASSDPILYVEDIQYAQDTDGKMVYMPFTSDGTNVGAAQVKLTWANS